MKDNAGTHRVLLPPLRARGSPCFPPTPLQSNLEMAYDTKSLPWHLRDHLLPFFLGQNLGWGGAALGCRTGVSGRLNMYSVVLGRKAP